MRDVYRTEHPNTRSFTFHRGTSSSRLDKIFANFPMNIRQIYHAPITCSDHQAVFMKAELLSKPKTGKGVWKLNVSLLKNEETCNSISDFWRHWKGMKLSFNCPIEWWEKGKEKTRNIFKQNGARLKKERVEELNELEKRLKDLYRDKDKGIDKNDELFKVEREIEKLEKYEMEGAKIRAGGRFVEPKEAPSADFFKIESRRKTIIDKVLNTNGDEVSEPEAIVNEVKLFYKKLYEKKETDVNFRKKFLDKIENKLNGEQRDSLEGVIEKEEVAKALKEMKAGKSPGMDGLGSELYLKFWDLVGEELTETINNVFFTGYLGKSMKTAIISILYKKGDVREIKNYRPVSLLTIDYKVITKVLKSRLSRVIGGLVHPDQACGIPKRSINDQLFNIQAVIERASSSGGALVAIDLRKAYDLISHDYMHEVLRSMNFGENFKKWMKILYQDPESMVQVNGFLSESFKVGRSVRQGCPRAEPRIKGIKVPNSKEVKNITFADDAMHPITANCITTIFEVYNDFGKASGAEVNFEKTEVLLLGTFTANIVPAEFRRFIVKAATLLGIPWDKNGACGEIFWPRAIIKIQTATEKWEGRRLSFVGYYQNYGTGPE
jgi:hypothetical protein